VPNNAEFLLGNSIPLFLFQNKMAMNNIHFPESELILNADGSIFHLHLLPEQVADKVILVGDPGRVELVASHFEHREFEVESREFRTVTGTYKGKRITVVSTGIGCDNIDIFGWMGYPMQIKINFLCRDSILAAPLCLDLVILIDAAARDGRYGTQRFLSFFLKSPQHDYTQDEVPENHLFRQYTNLKNAIREMGGYEADETID